MEREQGWAENRKILEAKLDTLDNDIKQAKNKRDKYTCNSKDYKKFEKEVSTKWEQLQSLWRIKEEVNKYYIVLGEMNRKNILRKGPILLADFVDINEYNLFDIVPDITGTSPCSIWEQILRKIFRGC